MVEQSKYVVNIKQDVTQDIKGRHVLFVEDIIDTGQNLEESLRDTLLQEVASLKIGDFAGTPEDAS